MCVGIVLGALHTIPGAWIRGGSGAARLCGEHALSALLATGILGLRSRAWELLVEAQLVLVEPVLGRLVSRRKPMRWRHRYGLWSEQSRDG